MTSALLPITFTPPVAGPPTRGIFEAVDWEQDGDGPLRFLEGGVDIRRPNFVTDDQVAVWTEEWNVAAGDVTTDKIQARSDLSDENFSALTVFAYDRDECPHRLMEEARTFVRNRASSLLARHIQAQVEAHLSTQINAAATTASRPSLTGAVGAVERALQGFSTEDVFILADAELGAHLANAQLLDGDRSPLGYRYVFTTGLGLGTDSLVGITQLYGWRGPAVANDHIEHQTNDYIALAEQSLVVGFERSIIKLTVDSTP